MDTLADHIIGIYRDFEPTKILIYTDSRDFMEEISKNIDHVPIIIATNKPPISSLLSRGNIHIRKTHYSPPTGFNVLDEAKEVVLTCYAEGLLSSTDKVLFVISSVFETVLLFDMKDIGIISLTEKLRDRIDVRILEAVFKISTMIVREGKEGLPLGGLLILGDVNNVMSHTREMIKNPLAGCTPRELNILDRDNWSTIKEYSMLDGAILFDKDGSPISAGRYVMFNKMNEITIKHGLGGRHLAAAYISSKTKAISVVVSSEGVIYIYKDGVNIFKLNMI